MLLKRVRIELERVLGRGRDFLDHLAHAGEEEIEQAVERLDVDGPLDRRRPQGGADGRAIVDADHAERTQRIHGLGDGDAQAVLAEQRAERDDLVVHRRLRRPVVLVQDVLLVGGGRCGRDGLLLLLRPLELAEVLQLLLRLPDVALVLQDAPTASRSPDPARDCRRSAAGARAPSRAFR